MSRISPTALRGDNFGPIRETIKSAVLEKTRVAPDTDLAGYPDEYPVWPDIRLNNNNDIEFFFRKNLPLFSFQQICLQISVIY